MLDGNKIMGIMKLLAGGKRKSLAIMLALLVSIYVAVPENTVNTDSQNRIDCTGLIAANYAHIA